MQNVGQQQPVAEIKSFWESAEYLLAEQVRQAIRGHSPETVGKALRIAIRIESVARGPSKQETSRPTWEEVKKAEDECLAALRRLGYEPALRSLAKKSTPPKKGTHKL